MKKQLLVILSIVAVAAGIFQIRKTHTVCINGSCSRVSKIQVRKPAPTKKPTTQVKKAARKAPRCANGMCSRK